MKAKYKKFLIICGKALMLLCLAAFALLCVFYYAIPKDEAQTIWTKAEGAAPTTQSRGSGIDLSKYPTANLISYPYYSGTDTTINGITYKVNSDGSILLNGTATANSSFVLVSNILPIRLDKSKKYVLSGCPSGGGFESYRIFIQNTTYKQGYSDIGKGVVFTTEYTDYYIYIIIWNGFTVNNLTFKPMLNVGETAYPYSPPYDLIYNDGYESGENAGHEVGYDEGYKDASDTLNLGVLYGATVSGIFTYTNGQTLTLTNGKPDFSYNSLNFNSIWGQYELYNGDGDNTLERADITLNFKTPFQYNAFPLYFLGDSDVMSATFITTGSERYSADITKYADTSIGDEYALIKIRDENIPTSIEVKALTIYFGRATDTLYNANIFFLSGGFLNGYDNGYNEGFSNGHTNGVLDGRQEGYDNGYNEGYSKGKTDALSQLSDEPLSQSIRGFVFSLFDAPVSTFLNTFNISYDGFDLGALVAFIFTGIVVIAVVRLLT